MAKSKAQMRRLKNERNKKVAQARPKQGFWERGDADRQGEWLGGRQQAFQASGWGQGGAAGAQAGWAKVNPASVKRLPNYGMHPTLKLGAAYAGQAIDAIRGPGKPKPKEAPAAEPEQLALGTGARRHGGPQFAGELGSGPTARPHGSGPDFAGELGPGPTSRSQYAMDPNVIDVDSTEAEPEPTTPSTRKASRRPRGSNWSGPLQSIGNPWGEGDPERIPGTPVQSIGNPWAYDPRD
jgi:hypothetical protein